MAHPISNTRRFRAEGGIDHFHQSRGRSLFPTTNPHRFRHQPTPSSSRFPAHHHSPSSYSLSLPLHHPIPPSLYIIISSSSMTSSMDRFRSVALNSDVSLAVLLESFNLVWFKCKPVCGQCQSMKSST